ncbi:hypothetical protein DMC30DRAFT_415270 [Rhodotorula diobovata]|uniref:DUF6534 domain-containing protein n=1 Tax=Rhodotorula diobovata TaxID=5288 RepID=A0A5C5FZL3_9BASI|nr:hypothetical protein DMC30DRAFT_415270 [Rhodotorula diobovata]
MPEIELSGNTLKQVLRPVLVGTFMCCCLCGIILCISFQYFKHFPRDRPLLKVFVAFLTLSSIAVAATCSAWTWISGKDMSSPDALIPLVPSFIFFLVMGITICAVQLWYGWRCWVMGGRKRWYAPALIAIGALAALGCIIFLTTQISPNKVLNEFMTVAIVTFVWIVLLLLVDLVITVDTFWYLVWKPRKEHGGILPRDSRLRKLAGLAAKTNAVGLLVQILIIILLFAQPGKFIYAVPAMLESMLYSGSVIAALLAREQPRAPSMSTYTISCAHHRTSSAAPVMPPLVHRSTSHTLAVDPFQGKKRSIAYATDTFQESEERVVDPDADAEDADDEGVQSSDAPSASTSEADMGEKSGAGRQEAEKEVVEGEEPDTDQGQPVGDEMV